MAERTANPCGRTRPKERPYEVWRSPGGTWEWRVLKKWSSQAGEAEDTQARWHCFVTSPFCPDGEYGDVYAAEVKAHGVRVDAPSTRPVDGRGRSGGPAPRPGPRRAPADGPGRTGPR